MDVIWKDPKHNEPPLGVPLFVTIHRDWQDHYETLACVCYYMVDPRDGRRYFFEAGDVQNGRIGPDHVRVIAWATWIAAYLPGTALA